MKRLTLIVFIGMLHVHLFGASLSLDTISTYIQKGVQTRIPEPNKSIVENIYRQANYHPLWIGNQNKSKVSHLIEALNDPLFNYKNKSFDQNGIKSFFFAIDNGEIPAEKLSEAYAMIDLALTNSMVRLVRFIVQGDVDWELVKAKLQSLQASHQIVSKWEISVKPFPPQELLMNAIENDTIYDYLTSLLPMEKRYRSLINILSDYRMMDKFPKIEYYEELLQPGDSSSRVEEIKKRLQIIGDYPKSAPIDKHFDEQLRQAILTYQRRYLIEESGIVDATTTYYLNQPVKTNIQAIITNLDKTKLYPKNFENEYVEVNVPDFHLRYYKNNQLVMKKGLVVGRLERPTPLFSDTLRYMVLNPTWTVTDNLIKKDLIPVLKEKPNYLKENNIHVFQGNKEIEVNYGMLARYEKSSSAVPFNFVQYPGENNALGRIKFMFPNKYSVYIHDTDNKSLLSRRYKIYSSGCMRVENPFDLARLLLQHTSRRYSQNEIDAILATNQPTTIMLRDPIPVHILYFTVYEENGLVYFKNDIYLYDQMIEESVEGNRKRSFTVPENRMVSVQKEGPPPAH